MANEKQIFRLPSAPTRRPANGLLASASAAGGQVFGDYALWEDAYPHGGVRVVLERMAELAKMGALNPDVRVLALNATEGLPTDGRTDDPDRTDRRAVAAALYRFVANNVEYVQDAHGVEQLQSAAFTLFMHAGDCDDMAVLCAALLSGMGMPVRLKAIGADPTQPEAFTHVYAEYRDRAGTWWSCDPVSDPGVDAEIAPGRVTTQMTQALHETGGPGELAIFASSGADLAAGDLAAGDLAGPAPAREVAGRLGGLAGGPDGPISGPDAWLQIVGRSHSGSVPARERFWIDFYGERSYQVWGDCNFEVAALEAGTGKEIASVLLKPWWFVLDGCDGEARLNFPLDFDPSRTAVTLEARETGQGGEVLGTSEPLYLTEEDVDERDSVLDPVRDQIARSFQLARLVGVAAILGGGGFLLFSGAPYIDSFFGADEGDA